jgi:hypothetical protein
VKNCGVCCGKGAKEAACAGGVDNTDSAFSTFFLLSFEGTFLSKYVASFFHMIRIICTPQKCSGFNQMEEAKN